jgi:putative ATP-grasp target RiPP
VDLTFTGAAPGNYTVTVLETSGCNPAINPRNFVINVPDGTDTQVPFVRVTDLLGNIIVTNDPLFPPVTLNATLPTINVPEGECGSQERFFAYGYDTCDGVLTTPPSISATAVTVTPTTIDPETQVTVDSDGFGIWDVEVHWSIGTSVVTVTASRRIG